MTRTELEKLKYCFFQFLQNHPQPLSQKLLLEKNETTT